MAEYIDKNALKNHFHWWLNEDRKIFNDIIDQQAVVKIVRCKRCRWFTGMSCTLMQHEVGPEWFCSEGWLKNEQVDSDSCK